VPEGSALVRMPILSGVRSEKKEKKKEKGYFLMDQRPEGAKVRTLALIALHLDRSSD
jgi:hypothetical protein